MTKFWAGAYVQGNQAKEHEGEPVLQMLGPLVTGLVIRTPVRYTFCHEEHRSITLQLCPLKVPFLGLLKH